MMIIDTTAAGSTASASRSLPATSNKCSAEKLSKDSLLVQTKPKSNRLHQHCRDHRRRHPVKSHRINSKAVVSTQAVVNLRTIELTATKSNAEDRRTITLQSIENKIVSQREVPAAETQVGNYPCVTCLSPIYDTGCEQSVYYDDDGYYSSSALDYSSASGIMQQANSCVCLPQQQQQSLCYTNACPQNYLYSPSYGNAMQQCSVPQPEYICIDSSSSSATAPTIVNQLPYYTSSSGYPPSQQFLCVSQAPTQNSASIIIQQQPQGYAQPVQFIPSPQESAGQYIQISSATPQLIQLTNQNQYSGLQMLSPSSYGSIGAPMQQQQQQYAMVNTPTQQPVYPQARDNSGASHVTRPVPNMFRNALVRTISNRTGLPIMASPTSGFSPPAGMTYSPPGASRALNARGPATHPPGCSIM